MDTFNERPRNLNPYTVKSAEVSGDTLGVSTTDHTGFGTSAEYADALQPGTEFEMETIGFSNITGLKVGGAWLYRKSDQQLRQDHEAFVAQMRERRRAALEAHQEEWRRREEALPEWIRERLASFHETGGEQFEMDGWAYELVVAELAVAYAASGGEDDEAVMAIADREGTSGNQHGMAKALAHAHTEGMALAGTVSALSPITGDADYSKGGA